MFAVTDILQVLHDIFTTLAVIVLTVGVAVSVWNLVKIVGHPLQAEQLYKNARWSLCQHIVFALEFMIAGDIIHTLLLPDYKTTIILGAMVVIRSVLGYFINLEMVLIKKS